MLIPARYGFSQMIKAYFVHATANGGLAQLVASTTPCGDPSPLLLEAPNDLNKPSVCRPRKPQQYVI